MKINEDLALYFGLTFRILFYSFFLLQILVPHSREWIAANLKKLNITLIAFGCCYLTYIVPYLFDGHNYGGGPEMILTLWACFFTWIWFYLNKLDGIGFSIKNHHSRMGISVICILFICISNSFFNYATWFRTWTNDVVSELFHAFLSFGLPIFALIVKNLKPFGRKYGTIILVLTISQLIFGISLSVGYDGYIGDDIEFSVVFISNSIVLLAGSFYNIFSKNILR